MEPGDSGSGVNSRASCVSLTPSEQLRKQIDLDLEKIKLEAECELEKKKLDAEFAFAIRKAELEAKERKLAVSNPTSLVSHSSRKSGRSGLTSKSKLESPIASYKKFPPGPSERRLEFSASARSDQADKAHASGLGRSTIAPRYNTHCMPAPDSKTRLKDMRLQYGTQTQDAPEKLFSQMSPHSLCTSQRARNVTPEPSHTNLLADTGSTTDIIQTVRRSSADKYLQTAPTLVQNCQNKYTTPQKRCTVQMNHSVSTNSVITPPKFTTQQTYCAPPEQSSVTLQTQVPNVNHMDTYHYRSLEHTTWKMTHLHICNHNTTLDTVRS